MTTIIPNLQQLLDSDNIDEFREQLAQVITQLKSVDGIILDLAKILALGSEKALEIGLGVLGRQLLKNNDANPEVIWLLLAAVLSRRSGINPNSPARISILGLIACVQDWESPIFALFTPILDSFFQVSLSQNNPLIAEQTLDFIATWGESYGKAPHIKNQLQKLKSLTESVLDQVDDLEIKDEWSEGVQIFLQTADQNKYVDQNIWSAASNLLKKIYSTRVLNSDKGLNNYSEVKDNIDRLITSSLAKIGTIFNDHNLSVAVRIDSLEENKSWSIAANVVDKLEYLFQEIADIIFPPNNNNLPKFTPAQAIPGSWTIILNMTISDNQSKLLAQNIESLALNQDQKQDNNSNIEDIWKECIATLKQDNLGVVLAVSSNNISEVDTPQSISTEDVEITNQEEFLHSNIRLLSSDIPQADTLDLVIDFASLLIQYPSDKTNLRNKFLEMTGITSRQFSYYRRAAEILGLADERTRPTTACEMLNRLPEEAKFRFLAHQFISSKVGLAWFKWQDVNDLADLDIEKVNDFLISVSPSLAEETAKRRGTTLKSWVKIFRQYL